MRSVEHFFSLSLSLSLSLSVSFCLFLSGIIPKVVHEMFMVKAYVTRKKWLNFERDLANHRLELGHIADSQWDISKNSSGRTAVFCGVAVDVLRDSDCRNLDFGQGLMRITVENPTLIASPLNFYPLPPSFLSILHIHSSLPEEFRRCYAQYSTST